MNKKAKGYQFKFVYKAADGKKCLSGLYDFGDRLVTVEHALTYLDDYARNNLIDVQIFDKHHMK